jgi:hypothetical protein
MRIKLTQVVSVLSVLTAWAYSLGWLKTYFYFDTFGISLSSLKIAPQDYLFESWYVLENVVFFVMLLWTAAMIRRLWVRVVAVLYLPLPWMVQTAFVHRNWPVANWLTGHDYMVYKYTPFVVLFLVILLYKQERLRLKELSWPYSRFYFVVFVIAIFAWSVSAAKHIGGADADRLLVCPAKYLADTKLHFAEKYPDLKQLASKPGLYILRATPDRYFILDTEGRECDKPGAKVDLSTRMIKIYDVPQDKIDWIEDLKKPNPGPGALF